MSPKSLLLVILVLTAGVGCNLLPDRGAKASGGQSTNAGGTNNTMPTRPQHDTYFPISAGAHSAADCNSCHGGFSTFKEFTCISCHEHDQQPTDAAHQGVTGYKYDSQACLSCHKTGTAGDVSRSDHSARFFPIDTGTPHSSTQCSDCHSNPKAPSQFTCISCHDHAQDVLVPKHAGLTGYQYNSNACLGCHTNGIVPEISRASHTFFPIDVGSAHASTQCSDCHANPNDKSQFTCTSCHDHAVDVTTPKHTNVADYTYDSAACYKCHSDGRAVFNHATLGSPPNCIKCHQDALAKATTTPASMHVANNFPATCETCHKSFTAWGPGTTMQHAAVGGNTSKCETCHMGELAKANTTPASAHVTNKFPTTCATCHQSFTSWGPGTAMQHSAVGGTTSKCETCHMGDLAKANTTPASAHVANNFPTTCATCHQSFTSWGPGTAMQHSAVGGTTSKCETCHMTDFKNATTPFNHAGQNVAASACKTCHTSFTTWMSFVHNNNCFNGTTMRGHQGATCVQCHTVSTNYSQSSCTACHQNRGTNCND